MKIRNSRMFSYPVLSGMHDDYKNSSFIIKVEAQKSKKNMLITITPELKCKTLEDLIKNNKAEMIVHFECNKTRYRDVAKMNFGTNIYEFAGEKLNGNLQIIAFIISSTDIKDFTSDLFNDEYGRNTFDIETGSLLGISNQPDVPVPKSIFDLSNITSIISVVPHDTDNAEMIIEYDEVKIYVKLPTDTFISYSSIGSEISNFTPILHSMIVVPALIHVLDLLAMEDNWIDFETYIWFKVIKKKCEEKYCEFNQKLIKEKKATILAQELINSPIIPAINNLMEMGA